MKLNIYINKEKAILSGQDTHGYRVIEIPCGDIPTELRHLLVSAPMDKNAVIRLDDFEAATADLAGVISILEAMKQKEAAKLAEKERIEVDSIITLERLKKRAQETPIEKLLNQHVGWFHSTSIDGKLSDEEYNKIRTIFITDFCGRQEEAEAAMVIKNARAEAKKQEEKAISDARAEKRRDQEARLLDWAKVNGSDRLKLAITLGVGDLIDQANEEFSLSQIPPGFTLRINNFGVSLDKPTLDALKALVSLKELVAKNDTLRCPRLREADDDTAEWVLVDIITPTENKVTCGLEIER